MQSSLEFVSLPLIMACTKMTLSRRGKALVSLFSQESQRSLIGKSSLPEKLPNPALTLLSRRQLLAMWPQPFMNLEDPRGSQALMP